MRWNLTREMLISEGAGIFKATQKELPTHKRLLCLQRAAEGVCSLYKSACSTQPQGVPGGSVCGGLLCQGLSAHCKLVWAWSSLASTGLCLETGSTRENIFSILWLDSAHASWTQMCSP